LFRLTLAQENFTALTRLDQNRAVAVIAERTGTPVGRVKNVVIWGNHSSTQCVVRCVCVC